MNSSIRASIVVLCLVSALGSALGADAQVFGRERSMRGAQTTRYSVDIQGNGGLDVKLANGDKLIEDAWAAVQMADEVKPRRLKLNARKSQRDVVENALGQGKCILLGGKNFLYAINTFETQPFLTLRLAYTNSAKDAVLIERLTVLAGKEGKDSGLLLGQDADKAKLLTGGGKAVCDAAALLTGQADASRHLAIFNGASGRVLVVGFLANPVMNGHFSVSTAAAATAEMGATFSFDWVPETPVTLQPGATLELPPMYLSVAGQDPVEEVRRYGRAFELSMGDSSPVATPDCPCQPVWSSPEPGTAPGARESIALAARSGFMPVSARGRALPCLPAAAKLDPTQRGLLATAVAFLGERWPDSPTTLPQTVPPLAPPAVPTGLFQDGPQDTWYSVVHSDSGEWVLYGLFNWDSAPVVRSIPVPEGYHTVFDFWAQTYLGNAEGKLDVEIPAHSARVLCLRPFVAEPMVIGAVHHIACGAQDLTAQKWDAATQILSGVSQYNGGPALDYLLLAPEGSSIRSVAPSHGSAVYTQKDQLVHVRLQPGDSGPVEWRCIFGPTPPKAASLVKPPKSGKPKK